jgi:hypothetical protein
MESRPVMERWNGATQDERFDWLLEAKIGNKAFKFLDWQDLPLPVKSELLRSWKPETGGENGTNDAIKP